MQAVFQRLCQFRNQLCSLSQIRANTSIASYLVRIGKGTTPEIDGIIPESLELMKRAEAEAKELQAKAKDIITSAKDEYLKDLIPYREACRKASVPCEFSGGRSANVSERVSFLLEKTEKGIRVEIKGRPETSEVIPFDVLKKSVSKAAYGFTDRHLGPREEIGNKGGGLGNRLRALISK